MQFLETVLRQPIKFTNNGSVAAAASPCQPSNTCVKIKGTIGQGIPENRIIQSDPKLYDIYFRNRKKRCANGLENKENISLC